MRLARNIWYSFPVQLLLLHLRKFLFMLLPWVLLALIVTGNMFRRYGWHFLFLDPEYFSSVSVISFFIVGLALGGFIFVWNITSYILNSFRFPFLAAFRYPFSRYSLNNSIIPLIFIVIYFTALTQFQYYAELKSFWEVVSYQVAILAGMSLMMAVTSFPALNVHIEKVADRRSRANEKRRKKILRRWQFEGRAAALFSHEIRVDFVLIHPFRARHVRTVKHYPPEELIRVFRLHHKNALFIEALALMLIIALGFLMENPFFQIPAGASILLLLSILIAPIGALSYWLRTWAAAAFIGLLLLTNLLPKLNFFSHESMAYGWDYRNPVDYSLKNIEGIATPDQQQADKKAGLEYLENWKAKVTPMHHPMQKPPLIVINSSGGGLKASLWAFRVLQVSDSITNHRFFDHVAFISGASGGMIGTSYYRELYLRKKLGDSVNLQNPEYIANVSKDILNAVSFTYVVNDLLFPWQPLKMGDLTYRKDRGYEFERKLDQNTGWIMNKSLGDYAEVERKAISPLLLLSSTIIDDGRRLLLSSQPVSYLAQPSSKFNQEVMKVDGIDGKKFFENQGGSNVRFTTAIRLNATFPYVMPNVYLPTNPRAQCMDAGMRDNYGAEPAMRFLYTFREWISKNCSRVIIIQARGDYGKNYEPVVTKHPSLLQRMFYPINSLYSNWSDYHDYQGDELMSTADSWLGVDLQVFSFEYVPEKKDQIASMSLHLTTRERNSILSTIEDATNRKKLQSLAALMGN